VVDGGDTKGGRRDGEVLTKYQVDGGGAECGSP
jgi:hypothetical protein